MLNLFKRANDVGIPLIPIWLPDGEKVGQEWKAINPTRADNNKGSFLVNLTTGKWIDNATGEKGGDVVSLYAYLNQSECQTRASGKKGYKSLTAGMQTEAALKILEDHDPGYFPDDYKNEKKKQPKKGSAGYWDGFSCIENGVDNPPELNTDFYENRWGECVKSWKFYNSRKKEVLIVCRFMKEGKKEDRPFTLWSNGRITKWRSKGLPGQYPLYNLADLIDRPNDEFILFEGQKAAECARKAIGDKYVCIGWYGGARAIKKSDLEPLIGRQGYLWPDADSPGRSAIKILKGLNIKLKLIYPPAGVKKGWDVADAIDEGQDIISLVKGTGEVFIDEDLAFPFRILGFNGDSIFFQKFHNKKIAEHRASSLSKGVLMTLMNKKNWNDFFVSSNGGVAWDEAINYILEEARSLPTFERHKIRKSGAWYESGEIIINNGDKLLVDNKEIEIYKKEGYYCYEAGKVLPYDLSFPISKTQAKKIFEITSKMTFRHPASEDILVGWILLAPYCGVLNWRPHIWLTGPSGSGKSWTLDKVVMRMLGAFAITGNGESTPPGLRQSVANNAVPVVMDEMESDNKKYEEYIDQNLKLLRSGSSGRDIGEGATIVHGTTSGDAREWIVRTMACLASVNAVLKCGADMERFTILRFDTLDIKHEKRHKKLKELEHRHEKIMNEKFINGFHARTYSIIGEVLKAVDVMNDVCSVLLQNRRRGDQIGTLMAGAYMAQNDTAPTEDEAKIFLADKGLTTLDMLTENRELEKKVIDEIFSQKVTVSDGANFSKQSIGFCLDYWFDTHKQAMEPIPGLTQITIKRELEQYGIKPVIYSGKWVNIATNHPSIRKILRNTPFANNYEEMLMRLDYCNREVFGPTKFAGMQKRYLKLNVDNLFGEIPF